MFTCRFDIRELLTANTEYGVCKWKWMYNTYWNQFVVKYGLTSSNILENTCTNQNGIRDNNYTHNFLFK